MTVSFRPFCQENLTRSIPFSFTLYVIGQMDDPKFIKLLFRYSGWRIGTQDIEACQCISS